MITINGHEQKDAKNPLTAIRLKCLDCGGGSITEIKLCPVDDCPLYIYRFGKNPNRTRKVLSEEQRKKLASVGYQKKGVV